MHTFDRYKDALFRIANGCPDPVALAKDALNGVGEGRFSRKASLVGRKFGRLTVLSLGPTKPDTKNGTHNVRTWVCSCECGGEKIASTAALNKGSVKSCGCLHAEGNPKYKRKQSRYRGFRDEMYNVRS
jgi:hypothetical protein